MRILEAANLNAAELQGAQLNVAKLQGVSLYGAQIQGASLLGANLQGASLENAQLQGADLSQAELQGAELTNANLFRTEFVDVNLDNAAVYSPGYGKTVLPPVSVPGEKVVELTNTLVNEWTRKAIEHVRGDDERPADETKKQIVQRLGRLKTGGATGDEDTRVTGDEDTRVTNFWNEAAKNSLNNEKEFPKRLAQQLGDLACSADGAPYVARGLLRNGRLRATGQHLLAIVDRMKKARSDPAKPEAIDLSACPGVEGFTEQDWLSLRSLDDELRRARAPEGAGANASSATSSP